MLRPPPEITKTLAKLFLTAKTTPSNLPLHQPKFSLILTGGGGAAYKHLLSIPGASSSFLKGVIPYDKLSCLSVLDSHDLKYSSIGFCSASMAAQLARAAMFRSLHLTPTLLHWPDVYGVSLTATIVSHYKRKGGYRAHAGISSLTKGTHTIDQVFNKGFRNREGEDNACSNLIFRAIENGMFGSNALDDYGIFHKESMFDVKNMPVNNVGERAEGVEIVQPIVPYIPPNDDGDDTSITLHLKDHSKSHDPTEITLINAGKNLKFPDGTVVSMLDVNAGVSESVETIRRVLEEFDGEGKGEMGRSWYTPSSPVIFAFQNDTNNLLTNKLQETLNSDSLFRPYDNFNTSKTSRTESSGKVKLTNWACLTIDGLRIDAKKANIITTFKPQKTIYHIPLKQALNALTLGFNPSTSPSSRGISSTLNAGGKFLLDCSLKNVSSEFNRMESLLSFGDYARLLNQDNMKLVNLSLNNVDLGSSYNDGSPSTIGVESVYSGDSPDIDSETKIGKFGTIKWSNGITYAGSFNPLGLFHGYGTKLYSRGGGYSGYWVNGKRHGLGVSIYDGKWGYEFWQGGFEEDKAEGIGWMVGVDGRIEEFEFRNGVPVDLK